MNPNQPILNQELFRKVYQQIQQQGGSSDALLQQLQRAAANGALNNPQQRAQQQQPKIPMPTDTTLPEQLQNIVPDSKLVTDLQNLEFQIDTIMHEKKNKAKQFMLENQTEKKILKIFVFHEKALIDNSKVQFTLRVQGHFFNIDRTYMTDNSPLFTSLVQKLYIEIDKNFYPDEEPIEWERNGDFQDSAGFAIKRTVIPDPDKVKEYLETKQQQQQQQQLQQQQQTLPTVSKSSIAEPNVKVIIHLKYDPPQYHPSSTLATLLQIPLVNNSEKAQLCNINYLLTQLWSYVKTNQLQDKDDHNMINNDVALKQIFNCDRMTFSDILLRLKEHLILPDPIEFDYPMTLFDADKKQVEKNFELEIDLPRPPVNDILSNKTLKKEIQTLNEEIFKSIERIKAHKARRETLLMFAESPIAQINRIINSQTRDLAKLKDPYSEERRFSQFYFTPQVREATQRYVQKTNPQPKQFFA